MKDDSNNALGKFLGIVAIMLLAFVLGAYTTTKIFGLDTSIAVEEVEAPIVDDIIEMLTFSCVNVISKNEKLLYSGKATSNVHDDFLTEYDGFKVLRFYGIGGETIILSKDINTIIMTDRVAGEDCE